MGDVATLHSESRVDTYDTETGEIQGQLLLGIDVPTVAVQRRGERTMTISEFNRQVWDFNEGDRLTVTCKDGRLAVKVKTGWEAE